ncbi:MAG: hypothetical protein HYW22_00675 [Candidatus Aenigmarchaeota archaeon]|nr:hypothetical protein [Candidatus Aenigmarchaeota archaeon]
MIAKRLPAIKVRISDLANGKYFYGSKEELKAGYVITPYGEKVTRVNVFGTVVEKFVSDAGNFSSITVDDGTDTIKVKSFEGSTFEKIDLGDLVRVVGKLKEYNGELYVNYEIVRKETDPNFELLAKTEVLNNLIQKKRIIDNIRAMSDQMDSEELRNYVQDTYSMDEDTLGVILEAKKKEIDYKPVVLDVIKKLDEGNGAEISKIFQVINLPENVTERTVNELINSGDLYEPKIGFLKKVN